MLVRRATEESMNAEMIFVPLRASAEVIGWLFIGYALALGGKMLVYRGVDFIKKAWDDAGKQDA